MSLPVVLQGEEIKPDGALRKIVDAAMAIPLTLDAAPTTIGGQLPTHGNWGFYGSDLYINLGGTVRKFTGTSV